MSDEIGTAITYGNFRRPRIPGVGRFTFGQALLLAIAGAVLILLVMFGQVLLGLVWLLSVSVALIPLFVPSESGLNPYQRVARRVNFKRARKRGETSLRQGPGGHVPDGKVKLPGLAAQMQISEHADIYGRPFGLLSVPKTSHHTLVIQTHPSGTSGMDQSTIDAQVARWGWFLQQLGESGDIAGASVVVETAPDTGHRLVQAATRGLREDAPAFARATLEEVLDSYPSGSPVITTKVTITFKGAPMKGKRSDAVSAVAEDIAGRLPQFLADVAGTGAGSGSRASTAQEIIDSTRVAFDPGIASDVEEARIAGGTGLAWDEVGPVGADAAYDFYRHDSGISASWIMTSPASSIYYEDSLARLLRPSKEIDRKRVTILYRPESVGRSMEIAERDVKYATFTANQSNSRTSAAQRSGIVQAEKTEEETSRGASLVRFGVIITATVLDEYRLPTAAKTITRNLAPSARLKIRPALGSQDTTFIAGLPLGLVLPEHMAIPATVRDSM